MQDRLDRFIASTFGNKEKASPEDIKVASEVFIKQNTYELVDPLDVKKKIDELKPYLSNKTKKRVFLLFFNSQQFDLHKNSIV